VQDVTKTDVKINATKKTKSKRITEIKGIRMNDFPYELYEKTMMDIYVKKIKKALS